MAKFIFKLQAVLKLKQQIENSLKNELGKAIQVFEAEKKILKQLKHQKKECMLKVSSEISSNVTVEKLRNYNAYISFIKQKIINQSQKVNSAKEIVDKYREDLVQAVKERKMLETLKQKQYEKFLKEQQKLEQKTIDEIISYKQSNKEKK